jgi:hypothetical protein
LHRYCVTHVTGIAYEASVTNISVLIHFFCAFRWRF